MPIVIDGRFTEDKKRSTETAPHCSRLPLTAFCAPVTQTAHGLSPPLSLFLFLSLFAGYGNSAGINDVRLQMEKPGRLAPPDDATHCTLDGLGCVIVCIAGAAFLLSSS